MSANLLCVLVDDDPDFLAFAQRWLSRICPDIDVCEFHNGLDALQYLEQHHADLVITDFKMPYLDGLRLTSAVRAADPDVPIVVISGEAMADEALARGASAFLPKYDFMSELCPTLARLGILAPTHAVGERRGVG